MDTQLIDTIYTSVTEKRANLTDWLENTPPAKIEMVMGLREETAVNGHLHVLDTAIERAEAGTLGQCIVCHGQVETELLEMDYTACVCLDHFTGPELRRLEAELEMAQQMQQALMPQQLPNIRGVELSAFSRPAQIIGGDYFDFLQFEQSTPGLAIADVAGHGISASLHMASLQALLRTLVLTNQSPADVVHHLNRLMIHNIHYTNFVTLFLAAYDPATGMLTFSNAGHNPPLLFHAHNRAFEWLRPTGPAVGLVEDMAFYETSLQLRPGDVLLLYTDGVTEARGVDDEEFGEGRLLEAVGRSAGQSAGEILHSVRDDLFDFLQKETPLDDITLVVYKIR
jgi:sigma-B regulation protein RsbU (phosphoserine phosphatase)